MLHFWAIIIKTTCPYNNYVKNKTKMFIFNLFSSTFLIFNFLRFLPCILLQRLFYYGSEAIEWFILLNYCVNPFDFSLETYLDLVLTQKNRTKLSFIQCTVPPPRTIPIIHPIWYRHPYLTLWKLYCVHLSLYNLKSYQLFLLHFSYDYSTNTNRCIISLISIIQFARGGCW